MGKYYIYKKPSKFGMGSDTDNYLVSDENLHRIMTPEEIEYEKKETVRYEFSPGLMELSPDIPVETTVKHFKEMIFKIEMTWDGECDVIVGEACFKRYIVDLSGSGIYYGRAFEGNGVYEFIEYDLKNVICNYYDPFTVDEKVAYLYKLIEDQEQRGLSELVKKWRREIEKLESVPVLQDEYDAHYYHQIDVFDHFKQMKKEQMAEGGIDHTRCIYSTPDLSYMDETSEVDTKNIQDRYMTYPELFKTGFDIRELAAPLTWCYTDGDDRNQPHIDRALKMLFDYQ